MYRHEDRLLRLPEVMRKTGLSKSAVYRMIQQKEFPKPVRIGSGSRWFDTDVENWMLTLTTDKYDSEAWRRLSLQ